MSAPLPPSDLGKRQPLMARLATGQILYRFYSLGFDPVYFDTSGLGRLNAPDGSYGVLYATQRLQGAFAETFLRAPGRRLIDPALLGRKGLVQLEVIRPMDLIAFDGPGLPILGATAEVVHGGLPYDTSQAWSKALKAHPIKPRGIAYSARHDPSETCYALFEPASVREISHDEALDTDWFWALAEIYRVGRPPLA